MTITKLVKPILILLFIGFSCQPAQAARYHFSQGGYQSLEGLKSDGSYKANQGRIYGEFEGDAILDDNLLQIENISLHFGGNSFFDYLDKNSSKPEFYFGNIDLSYNVATKTLTFVSEISLSELKNYDKEFRELSQNELFKVSILPEGLINIGDEQSGKAGSIFHVWSALISSDDELIKIENLDSIHFETSQHVVVSQVPLPSALGLFFAGLSSLGLIRRKN